MIKDIINKDLFNILTKAYDLLKENNYVRVLAHYDGDGVSSSIILLKTLERLNIKYHSGYVKNLDNEGFRELYDEEPDVLNIIVDAGSSQASSISDYDKFIILDHHFYNKEDTNNIKGININARDYGINGTREACGATMAFIFSLVIDENNKDLFPFFMAGATADKQDIGGLTGLNKLLYDNYNTYNTKHLLNFEGNIKDGITYSLDPFFINLTGYPDNVNHF